MTRTRSDAGEGGPAQDDREDDELDERELDRVVGGLGRRGRRFDVDEDGEEVA